MLIFLLLFLFCVQLPQYDGFPQGLSIFHFLLYSIGRRVSDLSKNIEFYMKLENSMTDSITSVLHQNR